MVHHQPWQELLLVDLPEELCHQEADLPKYCCPCNRTQLLIISYYGIQRFQHILVETSYQHRAFDTKSKSFASFEARVQPSPAHILNHQLVNRSCLGASLFLAAIIILPFGISSLGCLDYVQILTKPSVLCEHSEKMTTPGGKIIHCEEHSLRDGRGTTRHHGGISKILSLTMYRHESDKTFCLNNIVHSVLV